jgi:parvulin-like peptidyl-prolyl isomerase
MKILPLFLLLFSLKAAAQHKMLTQKEAEAYINTQQDVPVEEVDSTYPYFDLLIRRQAGDVVVTQNSVFKIIKINTVESYSAAYIYLNGQEHSQAEITTLRQEIIKKFKAGTAFAGLIKKYNEDGNPAAGNYRFTNGMVVAEFYEALTTHKPGDIFTIDVPNNKWYYVAMRNPGTFSQQTVTVLKASY